MDSTYHESVLACAKVLRKNQTPAEKILWDQLRNRKFHGYKFLRQKPILTYIVDFYCSELSCVIEVDGEYHLKQKAFDEYRTSELHAFGKTVIRYTNEDIESHLPEVLADLKRRIDEIIHGSDLTPNPSL